MFAINIENLKILKYHIFFKKILDLSIVYKECGHEYKKIFKEEKSIEKNNKSNKKLIKNI